MPRIYFDQGTSLKVRVTFEDPDTDEVTDPSFVSLVVQPPDDNDDATFVYGEDEELERLSEGVYQYILELTDKGTYHFHFTGTTGSTSKVISGQVDSMNVDF